ncbi:shikimate dehydrogenase [Acidocella sp.]|uniref:shikimate dehydrogenase n=1 Tax=Acidocella sp. TaxID=50710 RepID=UPI003D01DD1F
MNHVPPAATGPIPAHARGQILLGLIGEGIGPSRTPRMQMAEGQAQGLDIRYDLFDLAQMKLGLADLPKLVNDIEAAGYAGVNVTHPCKQEIIPLLHELSPDAKALGAVNTVLFRDGKRIGHNTDWSGFSESFRIRLKNADLSQAVQIGAGGAGSAVAYALLKLGAAKLTLIDADLSRAEALAQRYISIFPHAVIEAAPAPEKPMQSATGLVNCTPMGMAAHPGLPLPATLLRRDLWVAEIVYFPLETALVKTARALGCRVSDGGGMAVFQAVAAFRLFTGREPDAPRMLASFTA